jgi:uncharacterized membrane protein
MVATLPARTLYAMVVTLMSMDSNPPPPADPTPPPAAPVPVPPAVAPPPGAPAASSNMTLAALGYPIWICALIVVLTEKTDPKVKFHGWNGLFWGIAYIVVIVALGIVSIVLRDVPGLGGLLRLLMRLVPLAFLAASIIFAVNAYNRKPVNIPVISDMARKQAGG